MNRAPFGTTHAGSEVDRLTIGDGTLTANILTLGATLQDLRLSGVPHSLTLGGDDIAAYQGPMAYFGAIVGPVANRITHASAVIDGQRHHFAANEAGNTLHGGPTGTHALIWEPVEQTETSATLRLSLPDGLGGFPGRRIVLASFAILPGAVLQLHLSATTDLPTWMNLANHSYWNLDGTETTEGHRLQIDADRYLPVDAALLPTGVAEVEGTAYDFGTPRPVGAGQPNRYDNTICLSDARLPMRKVARLTGASGLAMTVETTEPGLQIYDGIRIDTAPFTGHSGRPYIAQSGFAIEAQGWPDALNHKDFPSIRLDPGETYEQITRWRFERPEA